MPSVRSVALGFWIGTGSRVEGEGQSGLSHLLEHLLFRGTSRYGSLEIDQIFDAMGAEINAGTGKETTSLYSRVLDVHLERAFDVMADMVWLPSLQEVDPERAVVLEEIAMYEDDPQDKIFDVLRAGGRPRGGGGARENREVGGRPAGQDLRRPRGGGVRRRAAGPRDQRAARGHPRHPGGRDPRLPSLPLSARQHGRGGSRVDRA